MTFFSSEVIGLAFGPPTAVTFAIDLSSNRIEQARRNQFSSGPTHLLRV
jgi:hypothetical protein